MSLGAGLQCFEFYAEFSFLGQNIFLKYVVTKFKAGYGNGITFIIKKRMRD